MNKNMRIYSFILSATLCLNHFGVITANAENLPIRLLSEESIIYETDFERLDKAHIMKNRGSSAVNIESGAVSISRDSTSRVNLPDELRLYPNADKSGVDSAYTGIELNVKRSEAKKLDLRFCDEKGSILTKVKFQNDGNVSFLFGDSAGGNIKEEILVSDAPTGEFVHLKVLMNSVTKQLYVAFDGEEVITDKYFSSDGDNFAFLEISLFSRHYHTASIDNFKVYEVEKTDADMISMDYEWLKWENFAKEPNNEVTTDIVLPGTGQYGSRLTWSTTDETVVTKDGKVTRSEEADKTAVLSVLIESNDKKTERSYEITVKRLKQTGVPSVKGEYLINDDMKGNKLSPLVSVISGKPVPTENGVLLSEGDRMLYLHDSEQSTYCEPIAYSMLLTGDGTKVDFYDTEENLCYSIKNEKNALYALTRDNYSDNAEWKKLKTGLTDKELVIGLDPLSNRFSAWYGDDKVAHNEIGVCDVVQLYKMELTQESLKATVSDLKVYLAEFSAEDAVAFDSAYLTPENLTWQNKEEIFNDLPLVTKGHAGADIIWTSDNEAIAKDGTVTPPASGVAEVTLTAVFSKGNVSQTKTFDFKVPARNSEELPYVGEMLMEENFDNNELSDSWTLREQGGYITVTGEKMLLDKNALDPEGETITMADLYFTKPDSALQGTYALEFTLRRRNQHALMIRLKGNGEADYVAANWYPEGVIGIYRAEHQGETGSMNPERFLVGDEVKFTMLLNTADERFSVWLDDKRVLHNVHSRKVGVGGLIYLTLWANDTNYVKAEIDNIRLYKTKELTQDRVRLDKVWLTLEEITSKDDVASLFGYVGKNLSLPDAGRYESSITWESLNPDIISHSGEIYSGNDFKTATLKATISSGNTVDYKEIEVTITPEITSDAEKVASDIAMINYQSIAPLEESAWEEPHEIMRSLNLPGTGALGSKITWKSDNENYIKQSGRVVRPRFDEENVTVKLTATVTSGNSTDTREFEFTVIRDEEFYDPSVLNTTEKNWMTDAEFFGVYQNGRWTTEPKLDYNYKGLEELGKIVKEIGAANDYTAAKEELLNYFQNKRKTQTTIGIDVRHTVWANAQIDGFAMNQNGKKYVIGDAYAGNEWGLCYADITPGTIPVGATLTLMIRSWYNESSYAEVARLDTENPNMRPRIELTMSNGEVRTIEALEDANIRAGAYKNTNYKEEEYLKVEYYGEPEGDRLSNAVLKFNFSSLKEGEKVKKAQLVFYARAVPECSGEKRLLITYDPVTTWEAETVNYRSFLGQVYNFNGIPTGIDWLPQENADGAYHGWVARLPAWPAIAMEYQLTQNEEYAYRAWQILLDLILDAGHQKNTESSFENKPNGDPNGLRGAYPGTIHTGVRAENVLSTLGILVKSRYATPDALTAVLKNLWDTGYYFNIYPPTYGNWRTNTNEQLMSIALMMPEFKESRQGDNWYETAREIIEESIFTNVFEDGCYMESSSGYAASEVTKYEDLKEKMIQAGGDTSQEYDERLQLFAWFQALCSAPDGEGINYGDSGPGKRGADWSRTIKWFGDKEFEYVATLGASGEKPSWTSRTFPIGTLTTLRGGWAANAPFLFTNVRGGGSHGHRDYNAILLHAYGRTLLTDQGIFSYTPTDTYRKWGISTEAHNTVLVNDTNQDRYTQDLYQVSGTIHDFKTNSAFDFLSQSTPNNPGVDHRRTITYIKPNIFIVSDLMTPEDNAKLQNYKQIWHMLPDANIEVSDESKTIRSNFTEGANIIIASADGENVTAVEKMGWYDRSYQQIEEAPFGYFEIKNKVGTAALDTVIMPNNADETAKLSARKLSDGSVAFDFTTNGIDYKGFYHMDYDGNGGAFGDYETDARVGYVQENADGVIAAVMLMDGTYVKNRHTGKDVFRTPTKVSEIYVDMTGNDIYVTIEAAEASAVEDITVKDSESSNSELVKNVAITVPSEFDNRVFVNGVQQGYNNELGYIKNIGSSEAGTKQDSNPIAGVQGVPKPEGDNSGGGGGGGGSSDDKEPEDEKPDEKDSESDTTQKSFPDTQGHWAEEYIGDLYSKGIVYGDESGNFNPDSSIRRSEFIAIAVRSASFEMSEYKGGFNDVSKDSWYADIIQTALDNGIIAADTNFRPDDLITREEMAKIICGIAKLKELYDEEVVLSDVYTDSQHISDWAKMYVKYIFGSGLMQGRSDGSFAPKDGATRAEAATVISRMLKMKKQGRL